MEDASEALLVFTVEESPSTFAAMDDENVVFTDPTLEIEDAREELFVVILLCNVSIFKAAEELFVTTVPCNVVIELAIDELFAFKELCN